ncbi:hypothetical protein L7F22_053733 [Adiantum nelumboides]|nr:hypothetical protein [Adiantum nelumboides]
MEVDKEKKESEADTTAQEEMAQDLEATVKEIVEETAQDLQDLYWFRHQVQEFWFWSVTGSGLGFVTDFWFWTDLYSGSDYRLLGSFLVDYCSILVSCLVLVSAGRTSLVQGWLAVWFLLSVPTIENLDKVEKLEEEPINLATEKKESANLDVALFRATTVVDEQTKDISILEKSLTQVHLPFFDINGKDHNTVHSIQSFFNIREDYCIPAIAEPSQVAKEFVDIEGESKEEFLSFVLKTSNQKFLEALNAFGLCFKRVVEEEPALKDEDFVTRLVELGIEKFGRNIVELEKISSDMGAKINLEHEGQIEADELQKIELLDEDIFLGRAGGSRATSKYTEANLKGSAKNKLYMSVGPMLARITYQALGMIEDLPAANSQAALIQNAKLVAHPMRTTTSATSSRATRSTKKQSSNNDERIDIDKEKSPNGSDDGSSKESQARGSSKFEKSDEEDVSTPLKRKGTEKTRVPRSELQVAYVEAQARVEERRKKLATAREAKSATTKGPTVQTIEQERQARIKKAKKLQAERQRIATTEQKAQEVDISSQSTQGPKEKEVVDIIGHIEHLKKIQREKNLEEQRAAALAREKIKEGLKRTNKEAVLEPREGEPKKQQQEEEENIENIQMDPTPPSPKASSLPASLSSLKSLVPPSSPPPPASPTTPSSPQHKAPVVAKEVSTQPSSRALDVVEVPIQDSQNEEKDDKAGAPEQQQEDQNTKGVLEPHPPSPPQETM